MPAREITHQHSQPRDHHHGCHRLPGDARHTRHGRSHVAVPAENSSIGQQRSQQNQPGSPRTEEPELPLQSRIGQRRQGRHPAGDQQQSHNSPQPDHPESQPPRKIATQIGTQRHTEQVGDSHPEDHDRHGLGFVSRIGHPLRNNRTYPEESPVRQARHEPHRQEHPKVGCQRSADVTQNNKSGKSEQNPLQRPLTCNEHRRGSPDANPDGIGRNQVPGPGDGNAQIPRHIGQNPHHDELGHAESQRAESQGDQTLFHKSTLFTDGSALQVRNLFRNFRILRTAPQLDNTARPKHGLLIRRTKIAHIFPSSA